MTSRAADVSIVLVHYHTPRLAAAAVAALRRDGMACGLELELLLIDNGSDREGRELLAGLPVELLEPGRNLGYAGGVNLGVSASSAGVIVVMNPDVEVFPGCLAALAGCLRQGAAAAGPRFYWDRSRRLLLPPAEPRSRGDELLAWLASRGERWAARARRRSRRHCRRHWQAAGPLRSYALSGSMLALTRQAWERVGPFDSGFQLYFEETDWLRRLERGGLPAWYVPAAAAVHSYGRSAAAEPSAAAWFAASAGRFRRLHYGAWFARGLELLARAAPGAAPRQPPPGAMPRQAALGAPRDGLGEPVPEEGLDLAGFPVPLWVEVSPNPAGFPAAAEEVTAAGGGKRWMLPDDIVPPTATSLAVRLTDGRGRELALFSIRPRAPE